MKACIERMSHGKNSLDLLEVGMVCVEAVREREMEVSLATEKLLVNLISHCMKASAVDKALECSELVKERLQGVCKEDEGEKDAAALLKTVADLLWSFSLQLEQQRVVEADRVLRVRQLSLGMLLLVRPDLQLLVTRATNIDAQFRKTQGRGGGGEGHSQHSYSQLTDLHHFLLSHKEVKSQLSTPLNCATLSAVYLWLLQAAKTQPSHLNKATSLLNTHLHACSKGKHAAESLLLELSWLTSSSQTSAAPSIEWVTRLQECSSFLPLLINGATLTLLHKLVDSVDCLIVAIRSMLKRSRECEREGWLIPATALHPLKELMTSYVQWVAAILKHQLSSQSKGSREEQLKCGAVSRQLSALSVVNDVLLDLLLAKEDEEEMELSRGCPPPPPQPQPKAMLATECLPLLEQSQAVLSSAPPSLPPAEHRWLGSSAYNLGLTLHQAGMNSSAIPVLEVACQELLAWCQQQGEQSFDEV